MSRDLTSVATEPRLRLERGELAGFGVVELGQGYRLGTLELAAKVTLADLDRVAL